MRRSHVVAVGCALAIAVVGASVWLLSNTGLGSDDGEQSPAASRPAGSESSPNSTPTLAHEAVTYLSAASNIEGLTYTDQEILAIGKSICTALDNGTPVAEVLPAIDLAESDAAVRLQLISIAAASLCTSHVKTVDAYQAANVGDGTWIVDVDIPAGTYHLREPASSDCRWTINKINSTIVIDENGGSGQHRVALRAGQDFATNGCGTWAID